MLRGKRVVFFGLATVGSIFLVRLKSVVFSVGLEILGLIVVLRVKRVKRVKRGKMVFCPGLRIVGLVVAPKVKRVFCFDLGVVGLIGLLSPYVLRTVASLLTLYEMAWVSNCWALKPGYLAECSEVSEGSVFEKCWASGATGNTSAVVIPFEGFSAAAHEDSPLHSTTNSVQTGS